ncbi:hypothetical protein HF086_005931 [Spodoptera exigua]|uniref:Uncharacterized protein n=1 Tax=Spodoptera exigua TaxID=7107 RepID=A0A922MV72_SPOEX|nr:hypothetical protein HF086_005931 [Spodoptera exigua]
MSCAEADGVVRGGDGRVPVRGRGRGVGARGRGGGAALAGAVFADSAGLQPAPYAMLADAFEYEFRGCAVALVSVAAWAANAVEVVLFPLVARGAGWRRRWRWPRR